MERLDKVRFKISNKSKFRTTVPVNANVYESLEEYANAFGFKDVDTFVSDLIYMYCNRNRLRMTKKGFSKRKPKRFVKVYSSRRNLNIMNAYAYATDMSFDSVVNLILKQAIEKIKKNRFKIGLEDEDSSTVHEGISR